VNSDNAALALYPLRSTFALDDYVIAGLWHAEKNRQTDKSFSAD
jgi:hypothetical protein